jgi:hypothetical protein
MRRFATSLLIFGGLILPSVVAAQACLGIPVGEGAYTIGALGSFTEGRKSFGPNVQVNIEGPLAVSAGYRMTIYDDVDPNGHGVSGMIAYDLALEGLSMCPVVGLSYDRISESEDDITGRVSSTVIPIGLGIGKTFSSATESLAVTLSATPQFLYVRTSVGIFGDEGSITVSDSSTEFGASLNAVVGTGTFYFGAGVLLTSIEESDPVFGIGVGAFLGG